jgi:hypothetical protein
MLLSILALIPVTMIPQVPAKMMTTIQTMKIALSTLDSPACVKFVEVIDGGTKQDIPSLSSVAPNAKLMVCY